MKNIADRINEFIDSLGISKNEFGKTIGISSSLISQITTKKNNFRADIIQKITSAYPQLNPYWLLNGIGEMLVENHNYQPQLNTQLSEKAKKSGKEYIQDIVKQFPSDYKPLTDDERRAFTENMKFIERNKQKLINELKGLKGDYEGLYSTIEEFEAINDVLREITVNYLDQFDTTVFHAFDYFTNEGFNYKQYKADTLRELEHLKPFKKPFDSLLNSVHQFLKEFKAVDKENILEDYYRG